MGGPRQKKKHQSKRKSKGLPKWVGAGIALAAAAIAAYLLIPGFGSDPEWPMDTSAEAVTRGEALFAQHCAECHGAVAVGQQPASPMGGVMADGTPVAPALNGTGHMWHHPPQVLFSIVKDGSPAPESPMLGWAGRLSDDEIRAILGYLHALWPQEIRTRYAQRFGAR